MEQQRNGGEHPSHLHLVPTDEQQLTPEESPDEQLIREGIEAALAEGCNVDDRTARYIASQLHEGQSSALYALASSGAIRDEIHDELTRDYADQPEQVQGWINWLSMYCIDRPDAGPIPGWAARAAEQDRAELAARISAAGTRRLGSVATVHEVAPNGDDASMDDQERDTFPWSDAARWKPEVASADEAAGSVRRLGAGAVGHEVDRDERPETASGLHPEIWVGSLADYTNGRLHGVWLDATLEPDELREAIAFMLRNGYTPDAEEWAILDYSDFGGIEVVQPTDLETVSRLANGIAEHGQAFAVWADYRGTEDMDYVEGTFEEAYRGTWPSMVAYVESHLENVDAYRFMESVPDSPCRRCWFHHRQ